MSSAETIAPGPIPGERATAKLYVAGDSPQSALALANLRTAFETVPEENRPTIEIIDIYDSPLEALGDGVIVTPTLIFEYLGKRRVIFGELSDPQQTGAVLASLTRSRQAGRHST
jgi:hypothetical protein